eukprot:CAMPEP_0203687668 /NCGR_PEP_ID=MMETSP0091-20130426/637_1 /ASSEMBLY_ACC=CAM_ASM_001089 /TAXON_ID=426623 /ORGANISM="Chaetoceros affinis, Strain CCMP159" /LENGTH=746 /DNA_ID=CAMNT_0050557067 /DNA_START=49 /DNA_END=2289 /DNA_ORIENTATION=-
MKLASALLLSLPLFSQAKFFNRISNFFVCDQIGGSCEDDDFETVAEIVAATDDGMKLVYTNSEQENLGFVDITDPSTPVPLGALDLPGEPTSVAVHGKYAAVGVNTSKSYTEPDGLLLIVEVDTMTIVRTIYLLGQPDSVTFSPDGNYIVVAIENERDEDLGEGIPPQMPAGFVVIVESRKPNPTKWKKHVVDVTGLDGVGIPEDPEPEYVAVNDNNIAVVTMQENNALVLIDLNSKKVLSSFTAGTVDLSNIDTEEEGVIDQTSSLSAVPREPDGVTWISTKYFATADEGDMDGGSRGFTIFDMFGNVVAGSGSELDQIAAAFGHYPEERSGNKGSEPENTAFGTFGGKDYLFVNAERSNLLFVYNIDKPQKPWFFQALPTSVGPEGVITIPSRNLVVVACEKDGRGDAFRSTLSIFEYGSSKRNYPTIRSWRNKETGVAIPWSAMSGLSPGYNKKTLYAVEDSFYNKSRFFTINTKKTPYIINSATRILDSDGVLASTPTDDEFTDDSLAAMINDDGTVNLDPEGIAMDESDGSLWIVSEGKGTKGAGEVVPKINLIVNVDEETGVINKVVELPESIASKQLKWGLEGIAYYEGHIVVCLQRAWQDMDHPKILVYSIEDEEWILTVDYPLDSVESSAGGWVGLADITSVGDGTFYVLERDNQGNKDAAVKRIYSVNILEAAEGEVLTKTLVSDLLPILQDATQMLVPEKIEGLAYTKKGVWLINDNDGVDDNAGETNLWNLGKL